MGQFFGILKILLALLLFGVVSYLYELGRFPLLTVACFFTGIYLVQIAVDEIKNG